MAESHPWTDEMEALLGATQPVLRGDGAVVGFRRPTGGSDAVIAAREPRGGLAALVDERAALDAGNALSSETWSMLDMAAFGGWRDAVLGLHSTPSAHEARVQALRAVLRDAYGGIRGEREWPDAEALVAIHAAFHRVVVVPLRSRPV